MLDEILSINKIRADNRLALPGDPAGGAVTFLLSTSSQPELVLKVYRNESGLNSYQNELRARNIFIQGGVMPFSLPAIFHNGIVSGRPYLIMEYLPFPTLGCTSSNARGEILTDAKLIEVCGYISSARTCLHQSPNRGKTFRERIIDLEAYFMHSSLRAVVDFAYVLELADSLVDEQALNTFSHGDLTSNNILCGKSSELWLIDWSDSGYGRFPMYDLITFLISSRYRGLTLNGSRHIWRSLESDLVDTLLIDDCLLTRKAGILPGYLLLYLIDRLHMERSKLMSMNLLGPEDCPLNIERNLQLTFVSRILN